MTFKKEKTSTDQKSDETTDNQTTPDTSSENFGDELDSNDNENIQQETGEEINDECDEAKTLENELFSLKTELDQEKEKRLRLVAEYDNYRRRTQAEFNSLIQQAGERLILKLLPVLDDFQRLFDQDQAKLSVEELYHGIELINKKLVDTLGSEGLEPIDSLDLPFDAEIHEAIAQFEDPEKDNGIVIAEAEKGFMLGDKIIRHPKVVVNALRETGEEKVDE